VSAEQPRTKTAIETEGPTRASDFTASYMFARSMPA
jgi:hypothetical protein